MERHYYFAVDQTTCHNDNDWKFPVRLVAQFRPVLAESLVRRPIPMLAPVRPVRTVPCASNPSTTITGAMHPPPSVVVTVVVATRFEWPETTPVPSIAVDRLAKSASESSGTSSASLLLDATRSRLDFVEWRATQSAGVTSYC